MVSTDDISWLKYYSLNFKSFIKEGEENKAILNFGVV